MKKTKNLILFSSLFFSSLILGIISKELLNVKLLIVNTLFEELSQNQLEEVLNFKEKWELLSYLIFDISSFSNGIYILKVELNNNKIIINKILR